MKDMRALASGVYLCRVASRSDAIVRKMALVR